MIDRLKLRIMKDYMKLQSKFNYNQMHRFHFGSVLNIYKYFTDFSPQSRTLKWYSLYVLMVYPACKIKCYCFNDTNTYTVHRKPNTAQLPTGIWATRQSKYSKEKRQAKEINADGIK